MSAPAARPPASLLRRYAAWSLDAAAIALLVMLAMHDRLAGALARCAGALDGLSRTMAATMQDAAANAATPLALLQALLADPALHAAVTTLAAASTALVTPPLLAFALLSLPWFAGFEASRWQATPGKRLLGLHVIDDDGLRARLPRTALRQVAGLLSWLSLNLGHAMAGIAPRYQTLHDRIAGTRVVATDLRPLPRIVGAWLALQPVAALALLALLMRAVDQSVADALDATWSG